jgi:hypothetical protein
MNISGHGPNGAASLVGAGLFWAKRPVCLWIPLSDKRIGRIMPRTGFLEINLTGFDGLPEVCNFLKPVRFFRKN